MFRNIYITYYKFGFIQFVIDLVKSRNMKFYLIVILQKMNHDISIELCPKIGVELSLIERNSSHQEIGPMNSNLRK